MPWSRVLTFDDPLHDQVAIRAGDWQVYPTKKGQFRQPALDAEFSS
jgi:hypothetical protein